MEHTGKRAGNNERWGSESYGSYLCWGVGMMRRPTLIAPSKVHEGVAFCIVAVAPLTTSGT
jgi:hypothetical protein